MNITIHDQKDFDMMLEAGKLAKHILNTLDDFIKIGISTEDINQFCHNEIIKHKAIPAPLNYHGFPKSVCTSINDVICHGIPNVNEILKDGDIINVDVTVILNGYYGDTSRMYSVGSAKKDIKKQKLINTTYECMMLGIDVAKPGEKLLDIGRVIQNHAEKNGFSVVRDFCGHGIGTKFHTEPNVLHYYPGDKYESYYDLTLQNGMFFTIEPMINEGKWNSIIDKNDKWTARTVDGKLSAQFEHTIGITNNGNIIFTN